MPSTRPYGPPDHRGGVKGERKVVMLSRAAERRKMHSLGREPQDWGKIKKEKAAERRQIISPTPVAYAGSENLSPPPGASSLSVPLTWGSHPWLEICRASGAPFRLPVPHSCSSGT